jgi:tetraacyldisaccharide 4'-kinase
MLKAPKFWYNKKISVYGVLLSPLSILWALGTAIKKNITKVHKAEIPVIAVGSAIIGGSGKTPSVLFLCEELEKMGYNPHIISRGYGGTSNEIIKVNPNMSYTLVGDEALMMSNYFTTWVSKNKFQAFHQAKIDGADILVLDDALQSFNIHKDLSIYVYDSIQSFGNRLLVPSGPLRETVKAALNKSQIFFLINTNICEDLTQKHFKQFLNYKININPEIREKKLIAFAGLGFNKKFFEQLQNENLNIVKLKDFPDHHQYTVDDMFMLLDEANKKDAFLITTEKDHTRIPSEFKSSVGIIHGRIISENKTQLANEIEKYI